MVVESRAALAEAARQGQHADADAVASRIAALGRAARRAAPGGAASEAREQLAALGRGGVMLAYEELRGAILATRWLWTPAPALLDEANQVIAARRAADEVSAGHEQGALPDQAQVAARRGYYLAQLERSDEPSRALSLLAVGGLVMLLGAAVRMLAVAVERRALLVATAGLAMFLLGLWRA